MFTGELLMEFVVYLLPSVIMNLAIAFQESYGFRELLTNLIVSLITQTVVLTVMDQIFPRGNKLEGDYLETRKMAKPAFDATTKGDLVALKKHPLWDKQSRRRNPIVFSRLQEYESNFMLLAATDKGYLDIARFLVEEVKVPVDQVN